MLIMHRLAFALFMMLPWQSGVAGSSDALPDWVSALKGALSRSLKTEVRASSVVTRDEIEGGEYRVIRLAGEGSLKKVPDPFLAVDDFFESGGWERDLRYDADGPGSSSSAFRKEKHLCVARVTVDSSEDEEETGRVPTTFAFEIDCRDAKPSGRE